MLLQNEHYKVYITAEDTKCFDPTAYDLIHDPLTKKLDDLPKVFSIDICNGLQTRRIALIADVLCVEENCAVLEDHVLTVLLNHELVRIRLEDGCLICCKTVDSFGCNWAIYSVGNGYVIHGEAEITMLDANLCRKWGVSAREIYCSLTKGMAFGIENGIIKVYDFEDTYYEYDLNGTLLKEIPATKHLE